MTCLLFVLLKALKVVETDLDYPIALGLLGLDVIGCVRYDSDL